MLIRAPKHEPAYKTLVQMYYLDARYDSLLGLMERWVVLNPGDAQTTDLLDSVRILLRNQSSSPATGSP